MHLNSVDFKTIMDAVLLWEKNHKMAVQEMLRLPLQTYMACQDQLLRSVAYAMDEYVKEVRRRSAQLEALESGIERT
jgi:hypothetical protein